MAAQDRALERWEQQFGLTHLSRGERNVARAGFLEGYAAAEVEVRALREALEELLNALLESYGGTFDPYPGRLMTAYTDARALAPEPAEDAPAPAGGA